MSLIGYAGKDRSDNYLEKRWYGPLAPKSMAAVKKSFESRTAAFGKERRGEGISQFRSRGMPEWARLIVLEVGDRRDVCPSEMASPSRRIRVTAARNEVIYIIRSRAGISTSIMARWFNRDHASILHSMACHSEKTGAPKLGVYNLSKVRTRNARKQAERRAIERKQEQAR